MNPHVTGALRNVLEELADSAPPPAGLAHTTLARARRQRITRLTAAGGLATVLCAALAGLLAGIVPLGGRTADDTGVGNGIRPSVVTAYSGVRDPKLADPSPAFEYSLLLNLETGRYDRIPFNFAMPSPDGSRVLVGRGDNSTAHPTQVGILDRVSGNDRWIPAPDLGGGNVWGYTDKGRWSPDGKRILFTYRPRELAGSGFLLADPETLQTAFVSLPEVGTENAQGLGLVWTPDSAGIALTLSRSDSEATPETVTGIRFYDITGRRLRTIPADTSLIDAAGFSPDGSQLALVDQHGPTTVTVADAATGAPRRVVDLSRPARLIGWADDDHLLVFVDGSSAPPGAEQRDELLVVDLDGQIVRTIRPAASAQHLFTGPSSGIPASVADLTF